MGFAKHTSAGIEINKLKEEKRLLEEIVNRKDQEIKDIKTECAEQFKNIKDLCFINNYGDKYLSLRKIHEIASDNFSALVKDIVIDSAEENKIIELPTTRKSSK